MNSKDKTQISFNLSESKIAPYDPHNHEENLMNTHHEAFFKMIVSSYLWNETNPEAKSIIDSEEMFCRAKSLNLRYYNYIDWVFTDIEAQLAKSQNNNLMPFVVSRHEK